MLSSRSQLEFVAYVRSYAKSGLILPGQVFSVWDPSDPTSKQMANYFTHPDQIPVSKGEKLDNAIEAAVTTVDKVIGYCRAGSVFPQTFGLACCAMEMIDVCFGIERGENIGFLGSFRFRAFRYDSSCNVSYPTFSLIV